MRALARAASGVCFPSAQDPPLTRLLLPNSPPTPRYAPYVDKGEPANATFAIQALAQPGFWADAHGRLHQCPEGRYGYLHGMSSSKCSGVCRPGHMCRSHPYPPSTNAKQLECGGPSVYCPAGTGNAPLRVRAGHYTVGGSPSEANRTREAEAPCEPGWFCAGGIKAECDAGFYGAAAKQTDSRCSGACPAGFSCPRGSVAPRRCDDGEFSGPGAAACTACPNGSGDRPDPTRQRCRDRRECCSMGVLDATDEQWSEARAERERRAGLSYADPSDGRL